MQKSDLVMGLNSASFIISFYPGEESTEWIDPESNGNERRWCQFRDMHTKEKKQKKQSLLTLLSTLRYNFCASVFVVQNVCKNVPK